MANRESLIDVIMEILGMNNSVVLNDVKLFEKLILKIRNEKYIEFINNYKIVSKSIATRLYKDPNRIIILSISLSRWLIPISRNIEELKKDKVINYNEYLDQTLTLYDEFMDELSYCYGIMFHDNSSNIKKNSLKSLIRTLIK